MEELKIEVHGFERCNDCKKVVAYLDKVGIEYKYVSHIMSTLSEMGIKHGVSSAPIVLIDGVNVDGDYSEVGTTRAEALVKEVIARVGV